MLQFFLQKGELLRAVFRVNAHNRLEVCLGTVFTLVVAVFTIQYMKHEVSIFYFVVGLLQDRWGPN